MQWADVVVTLHLFVGDYIVVCSVMCYFGTWFCAGDEIFGLVVVSSIGFMQVAKFECLL